MEPNTAENSTKELKAKNSNNEWWKGALVSNDIKNKLCENGWECLVSKTDLVIFRKPKPNSTACIYKGNLLPQLCNKFIKLIIRKQLTQLNRATLV